MIRIRIASASHTILHFSCFTNLHCRHTGKANGQTPEDPPLSTFAEWQFEDILVDETDGVFTLTFDHGEGQTGQGDINQDLPTVEIYRLDPGPPDLDNQGVVQTDYRNSCFSTLGKLYKTLSPTPTAQPVPGLEYEVAYDDTTVPGAPITQTVLTFNFNTDINTNGNLYGDELDASDPSINLALVQFCVKTTLKKRPASSGGRGVNYAEIAVEFRANLDGNFALEEFAYVNADTPTGGADEDVDEFTASAEVCGLNGEDLPVEPTLSQGDVIDICIATGDSPQASITTMETLTCTAEDPADDFFITWTAINGGTKTDPALVEIDCEPEGCTISLLIPARFYPKSGGLAEDLQMTCIGLVNLELGAPTRGLAEISSGDRNLQETAQASFEVSFELAAADDGGSGAVTISTTSAVMLAVAGALI